MIKRASGYRRSPKEGVLNRYDNSQKEDLETPCVWGLTGLRGSGKTYLIAQYLLHSQRRAIPLYDRIWIVTSSWQSNRTYWQEFIDDEDAFYPTDEALKAIMDQINGERDAWNDYVKELRFYDEVCDKLANFVDMDDDTTVKAMRLGYLEPGSWLNGNKPPPPQWKRDIVRPAQTLVILDDIIGTSGVGQAAITMRLAIANRHVGGLAEVWRGKTGSRSAIGASIIYTSQVYKTNIGGIARPLRANCTHQTIFRIRDPASFQDVAQEIGSFVGRERFVKAYLLAIEAEHGSLTVTFKPPKPELQFRRGLGELILIPKKETFEELEGKDREVAP